MTKGQAQAAQRRAGSRAPALAVACGALFGIAWAIGGPWLIGLDVERTAPLRAWLAGAGLLSGVLAALLERAVAGVRTGLALATTGSLAAALAAALLAPSAGGPTAVAIGLCGAGAAVVLGVIVTLARPAPPEAEGVPVRRLVAGVCGALAVGAWALASGHVLGQRVSDSDRRALDEARDLVAISAARLQITPDQLDALAAHLAPPGGWLVSVDEHGTVQAGVGAGTPVGSTVALDAARPDRCRAGHHELPCAVRVIAGERRLVAAVVPTPTDGSVVLAFALAGLFTTALALAIGGQVGAAPARELDRVSERLDELARGARGPRGMERQVVVASLDEIGDLAAALARLRARLGPALSEYHTALEKAQSADRARTEFLSLVSAELRSPLEQLVAAAEAMLDPNAEPMTPEQADDVRTVLSAARHLTDLIDEVLDVSAIASGQVNLRLADLDLGLLASDVAKTQRPQLSRKGVELHVDVESPSPRVMADERRLRQVLTNLITNAVKFTERGSIYVAVHKKGERVEVSVRDTGPGIAPEALPRLFHEFVQLGSLKQRAHGTGLGLAICKRLVEAHGGEVSAESQPGEGSTFRMVVPVEGPPARTEEQAA